MVSALQPKFPGNDPDYSDSLLLSKIDIFASLNCVRLGQVQSFNSAELTCKVQILGVRVLPDGTTQSYPPLIDVPVITMQGGGAALTMPIQAGDQGLVFFSDRNIDAWFNSGSAQPPADARMHDLSDGFILLGVNALTSSVVQYIGTQVTLSYLGAQVALRGGRVNIQNGSQNLATLLSNFLTILINAQIDTVHGVFAAPTVTSLTSVYTAIAELFN